MRLAVLIRDNYRCHICGTGDPSNDPADSIDHVIPRKLRIDHDLGNLKAAHRRCNSSKGARAPTPTANIDPRWRGG
jgi:5-methylcytosine-specific restriction endonuclease McrA